MDEHNIFSIPPSSGAPAPSTPPKPPFDDAWLPKWLKRPWIVTAIALFIVAIVIAFSINRIMLALLHSRPEVVVPKIEGKSLMEALSIVSPLDLSLQQDGTDFDESLPAGTVLHQLPSSGMSVRAGRSIRVVISKGGQVVFVPNVVGKLLAEAQSMLATDGIQMGAVSELFSNDSGKNVVLTQSPNAGTVVTRGAFVDVDVSKGPAPVGLPLLPDFTGKTVENARDWATGVNASVKIKEDPKAVGPAGTIVKQDPFPGQPLMEEQEIMLTVVPLAASQKSRFTYQVPAGSGETTVRIMARNDKGESQIYEGKHKGGTVVEVPVSVKSTTRFRIYLNDVLKEEKVVQP